jgi:hypothetical protein
VASGITFVPLNYVEGREGGGGQGRGWSGGEHEGPAAVDQVLTKCCAAGGKSAGGAKGLTQGPDKYVGHDPGLTTQTAPAGPQRADGMSLVDNQGGPVPCSQSREVRQRGDVTVHTEEGLSHDELPASRGREGVQALLRGGNVKVAVEAEPSTGEAAGIDDAGVVGVVAENEVSGSYQGR